MVGRGSGRRALSGMVAGALAIACSGHTASTASKDAGREAALVDAGAPDDGLCGVGDVFCQGFCQKPGLGACGESCTVCAVPAQSHGGASCVGGACQFQCEGGYARCGAVSCCGAQLTGNVTEMAVGGQTSCAVTSRGSVLCWGDDSYGALGRGDTSGVGLTADYVAGLSSGVLHVGVGDHHACAVLMRGSVVCWGDDRQGQLGDGQKTPRGTPVTPAGLDHGVLALAVGGVHSCAITTGRALSCWGDNVSGQLGRPGGAYTPELVTGLSSGVVAVAAGEAFTCAIAGGGKLLCWGDGSRGQLGGPAMSATPVAMNMPGPVTAVAAAGQHACAVLSNGNVVCWGAGDANQLGSVQPATQPAPVVVAGLAGVVALGAGGTETCAVDEAGAVQCWGADPVGDTAGGPAGPAIVPSLLSGMASVVATTGHACAVTTGGAGKCWGTNTQGNLGDGTIITSWAPIDVPGI